MVAMSSQPEPPRAFSRLQSSPGTTSFTESRVQARTRAPERRDERWRSAGIQPTPPASRNDLLNVRAAVVMIRGAVAHDCQCRSLQAAWDFLSRAEEAIANAETAVAPELTRRSATRQAGDQRDGPQTLAEGISEHSNDCCDVPRIGFDALEALLGTTAVLGDAQTRQKLADSQGRIHAAIELVSSLGPQFTRDVRSLLQAAVTAEQAHHRETTTGACVPCGTSDASPDPTPAGDAPPFPPRGARWPSTQMGVDSEPLDEVPAVVRYHLEAVRAGVKLLCEFVDDKYANRALLDGVNHLIRAEEFFASAAPAIAGAIAEMMQPHQLTRAPTEPSG